MLKCKNVFYKYLVWPEEWEREFAWYLPIKSASEIYYSELHDTTSTWLGFYLSKLQHKHFLSLSFLYSLQPRPTVDEMLMHLKDLWEK